ncbi:hypothetical protein [Nocardiopsis sp. YSL2]|uniref:hypothetical protein n=1 Tax=Nocardiopsis sp. YSL2 TaxID=2939492 RepID=UPI0026F438C3|nr:hypothetical protein [Nocardiopsis sp. YSL2]
MKKDIYQKWALFLPLAAAIISAPVPASAETGPHYPRVPIESPEGLECEVTGFETSCGADSGGTQWKVRALCMKPSIDLGLPVRYQVESETITGSGSVSLICSEIIRTPTGHEVILVD